MKVLGVAVGYASVPLVEQHLEHGKHINPLVGPVVIALGIAGFRIFIAGRNVEVHGRRHLARVLLSTQHLQDRSFVLYLRSFKDDASRAKIEMLRVPTWTGILGNLPASRLTQEEQLVAALSAAGPVLSLGAPKDRLPKLGALRIYVPNDSWQDTVVDLLPRARLVVMVLGPGKSLEWELLQAIRIVSPERLVLFVFMARDSYSLFRRRISRTLDQEANKLRCEQGFDWSPPTFPESATGIGSSTEGWYIEFDEAWTPRSHVVPGLSSGQLENPSPTITGNLRRNVSQAMQPVFNQLDRMDKRSIFKRSSTRVWQDLLSSLFLLLGPLAAMMVSLYTSLVPGLIVLLGFIICGTTVIVISGLLMLRGHDQLVEAGQLRG